MRFKPLVDWFKRLLKLAQQTDENISTIKEHNRWLTQLTESGRLLAIELANLRERESVERENVALRIENMLLRERSVLPGSESAIQDLRRQMEELKRENKELRKRLEQ